MPQFRTGSKLAALALLAAPGLAHAQAEGAKAAQFDALITCRSIAEPTQRLACFDAAAARLAEAEKAGDVVVVSREQARTARRQAFGFSIPSLSIFERGEKPEEVDRVDAPVARAWQTANGRWAVELDGGAVWEQIDSESVYRAPKAGSRAQIRRAALGSYMMNLDGQRAVRARRVK